MRCVNRACRHPERPHNRRSLEHRAYHVRLRTRKLKSLQIQGRIEYGAGGGQVSRLIDPVGRCVPAPGLKRLRVGMSDRGGYKVIGGSRSSLVAGAAPSGLRSIRWIPTSSKTPARCRAGRAAEPRRGADKVRSPSFPGHRGVRQGGPAPSRALRLSGGDLRPGEDGPSDRGDLPDTAGARAGGAGQRGSIPRPPST